MQIQTKILPLAVLVLSLSLMSIPLSYAQNPVLTPSFTLTPTTATNPVGTSHTLTATGSGVVGGLGGLIPCPFDVGCSIPVSFTVSGANAVTGSCTIVIPFAGFSGSCTFTYTGKNCGTDTIIADSPFGNDRATKIWTCAVGGEIESVDASALMIAGAFTNAYWILPLLMGIAGTVIGVTRRRKAEK